MTTYVLDAARTRPAGAVRGVLATRGEFARLAGSVMVDEHGRFQSLEVAILTRSLRTGLLPRDLHLRTASFLDAHRYPVITYRSQQAELVGTDRYAVQGVLRLHGQEHPVTLEATLTQDDRAAGVDGAHRAYVTAIVPRAAFDIPRNAVLRTLMPPLIGDQVFVTADVFLPLVHDSEAATPIPASQAGGLSLQPDS
jgi:polyisoprenoid-binding protein YceI